jgi:ABC-type spermidine/putrescine transport system permease subunit II
VRALPVILLFTGLFVLPLAVLVFYTVAPGWTYPQLLPPAVSGRSLEFLARRRAEVLVSLASSFTYSTLTVACTLGICLLPASVFARREFRGRRLLESLALAPALVPAITYSVGIHFLFIKVGLADRLAGVVLVLAVYSYPYMLRALVAGFLAFGPEHDLCARNLGAGPLRRVIRVELHLLLPAVAAGGTVVFLVSFSEYFLVFLIGGGAVPSYTGYLFPFLNSSDRSVASLLTLVFMAVPVLLFLCVDLLVAAAYRRRGMLEGRG